MSAPIFVLLALAGGCGAVTRLMLDGAVRSRLGGTLPWATILINITGSFLLGLVTGLLTGHVIPPAAQLVVGSGFLGGYTTFSSASLETVRLLQERAWVLAAVNALGTIVAATVAAAIGLWLGASL